MLHNLKHKINTINDAWCDVIRHSYSLSKQTNMELVINKWKYQTNKPVWIKYKIMLWYITIPNQCMHTSYLQKSQVIIDKSKLRLNFTDKIFMLQLISHLHEDFFPSMFMWVTHLTSTLVLIQWLCRHYCCCPPCNPKVMIPKNVSIIATKGNHNFSQLIRTALLEVILFMYPNVDCSLFWSSSVSWVN